MCHGIFMVFTRALSAGGGIYMALANSGLQILNSSITRNRALQGGGIYLGTNHKNVRIANTVVSDNSARLGGGMHVGEFNTKLVVVGCSFEYNVADECAAALYMLPSGVLVIRSLFLGHVELSSAPVCGSVTSEYNADGAFVGNSFINNYGYGALQLHYSASNLIVNNTFAGNMAFTVGGAISVTSSDRLVLYNNTFRQNSALIFGGAISASYLSNTVFLKCSFEGNIVHGGSGGAIYLLATNNVNITGVMFAENLALTSGGSIFWSPRL